MSFDGFTIANVTHDLNKYLIGGRISKIAQPEKDELLFTIKCPDRSQLRLIISANASLPLIYITDEKKQSPLTAPNFCMLLRKHIQNGKILKITQPDMERVIIFEIEHLDEMGDLKTKQLIVEIMGKHSNIIFADMDNNIIDSIKHVSANMSSVREVLPGRTYFIPKTVEKFNPLLAKKEDFFREIFSKNMKLSKCLYSTYTGISPVVAEEILYRSLIDPDAYPEILKDYEKEQFYNTFCQVMDIVKDSTFTPVIVYDGKKPVEYAAIKLNMYHDLNIVEYDNISTVLKDYYKQKEVVTRIRQKSVDLRKITSTAYDRARKKLSLQEKQLKDTEKRDKYRIYGELINTYGYDVKPQSTKMEALNYYTNENITIPLDKDLTPHENSVRYFNKYNKLKRTFEALSLQIENTRTEIEHLESISICLDIAENEEDLVEIKEELTEYGYINKKRGEKKAKIKSSPFHYISSDGFDIFIGKNNYQNDILTFKNGTGNDWWFHAKKIPGSHVLVKTRDGNLPDKTFEEAARLAAYYSKARENAKVEVDYLQIKNVKKPNGAKPGFVVYYTNYSMTAEPDISGIKQI
ncbi:Predicted component of the ribosome quality control (RQC) complex, YloA/Tae2 family, contains fibronectin-binding (FbpA) and DUF814 domains [Acetitomaculum ruminis DSM 5522]|uniref:Rqc2 homolog RqcH n=1 Tax=Acetitomaculum ruminis DSM 5522 TaxID=1120918 RepID=A0A1I0VUH9_9FIRM|nr:NFACT RNA binding domain-containing protein [Acetitomaculum ruminis]SFA79336.1 Predicted component of the ribosome quality control (RQC) complex, YloA/Tae2 family, contains fibronectin-binding (FbpA) and DUF814 domains [Acetitomaculum ruminis DSM 5522]